MMLSIFSKTLFITFIAFIPIYARLKGVKLFSVFTHGAIEGGLTIFKVFPYLLAFLIAIGMLRASGFFGLLTHALAPVLQQLGIPIDIVPLAIIRPFSGSAANAVMADIMQTHGGNAFISKLAATMMGSTETTFYVIAIYFGAVGISKTRYAIPVGLLADLTGVVASVWICHWLFS